MELQRVTWSRRCPSLCHGFDSVLASIGRRQSRWFLLKSVSLKYSDVAIERLKPSDRFQELVAIGPSRLLRLFGNGNYTFLASWYGASPVTGCTHPPPRPAGSRCQQGDDAILMEMKLVWMQAPGPEHTFRFIMKFLPCTKPSGACPSPDCLCCSSGVTSFGIISIPLWCLLPLQEHAL